MRVILMHNPGAGRGEHEAADLMGMLETAGQEVRYQSTKDDDYAKALDQLCDVVLAAGGDGTVGKVAKHLIGRPIPLGVLALGTANNLAHTLGFHVPAQELISALEIGRVHGFDVGLARGPWGERHFFEGAGGGLLPDYIHEFASVAKDDSVSKETELTRHVSLLRRILSRYRSRRWEISVDGEDVSGDYLLFEAMNIRSVGPVLVLASDADTADGKFDFVAVDEIERSHMAEYLAARLTHKMVPFPIPSRQFRNLRIRWEEGPLHFDDKIWPAKDEPARSAEITITVEPSALKIWLPSET
jgi:diacylglycerol kinase family enzyme